EEILEELRDQWQLMLNVDPESNVDDEGNELGITHWRLLARTEYETEPVVRYVEVFLRASCLAEAEELARDASDGLFDEEEREPTAASFVEIDRVGPEEFRSMLAQAGGKKAEIPPESGVVLARWAG